MGVRLQDLLGLNELKELKLVAGGDGLDRVLHWAHVVDLPDVMEWVQGGELLLTTCLGIKDNLEQLPTIVLECCERGVAGLVINIGPYIKHTPREVIVLANELGFPIFEVAWEVKLVRVTKAVYDFIAMKHLEERSLQDILENILYGDPDNYDNLLARAASCEYDLSKPQQIMVIRFEGLTAYLQEKGALSEQQRLLAKMQIQNSIISVFERFGKKVFVLIRLDTAIIMLPTLKNYKEQQKTRAIAGDLLQLIQTRYGGLNFCIGWGNSFASIAEAKVSLEQAEQASRVPFSVPGSQKCMGYDELGFYKVLFAVKKREDLESFRDEVLDQLLEYDRQHGAELVDTLTIFLEENENFARVSERLFIHRNTLKYRLQKIIEISGRNIADPKDRMLLYFATIVHRFLQL